MTDLYNNPELHQNISNDPIQLVEFYNNEEVVVPCEVMLVGISDLLIFAPPILAIAKLCCF
jgi:hypothetical protein